jgi:predicted dehydrogenase
MILRAAIIGCGLIGTDFPDDTAVGIVTHAGAYRACQGTQLVALADSDAARLQRADERWGVAECYCDAQELFERAEPEIVSICTPDPTHYALVKVALNAPSVRAVLAEKPLAMTSEEAGELVRLAEARGVILAVNYSRRHSIGHRELTDRLRGGEWGSVMTVGGYYTKGTLHNGTHWFDLARMLVGEVASVTGFDMLREEGVDPTYDAVLRFENGAGGHLQSFSAAAGTLFEMDILGTKGRVRVIEPSGRFATSRIVESKTFAGYRVFEDEEVLPARNSNEILHAIEDLVDCVQSGRAPRCAGSDGVAAVRIGEAVRESVRSGCMIQLKANG